MTNTYCYPIISKWLLYSSILFTLLLAPLVGAAQCGFTPAVRNQTVTLGPDGTVTVLASSFDNGSTSTCGPLTFSMQGPGTVSQSVAENGTLTLTAPVGAVFTAVLFASYGTPTGSAGNYAIGGCNATNSVSVVKPYLLNQNSASIGANNGVFGDPCVGTVKSLAVTARYNQPGGSFASQFSYTCADIGSIGVNISVTDANGNTSTLPATLTIQAPAAPLISAISPSPGHVGETITVTGSNLNNATSLVVNGAAATMSNLTATGFTFVVPAGAAATGNLVLSGGACGQSSSTPFTVAPLLSSFTPLAGAEGASVSVTGTSLANATSVTLNGQAATIISNTNTRLSFKVPVGASTGTIAITTSTGTGTTATLTPATFMVGPGPVLSSFTPTSGSTGTIVTLTGTGFTGATQVLFGNLPASSFTVVSTTQITVPVPAGVVVAPLTVTTPFGTSTSPGYFTAPACSGQATLTASGPTTFPAGSSVTLSAAATVAGFAGSGFGNGQVSATVALPNGQLLVGGTFTTYNGTTVGNLVRLNADGTLNNGSGVGQFNVGTGLAGGVSALAVQADGKILVGGTFTIYNGQTTANGVTLARLLRLNTDGTLDTGTGTGQLNVGTSVNSTVSALAVQADGKILVGGIFSTYKGQTTANGVTLGRLLRLTPDGTLDSGTGAGQLNVGTSFNSTVLALAVQADGKLLVGGAFSAYNNLTANRIARLNSDGSLDTDANGGQFTIGTGFNSNVSALAIQADGKILVGGAFTTYKSQGTDNGVTLARLVRLAPDGTLDNGTGAGQFNTGTNVNSTVSALAVQADGKILVGGLFTAYQGLAASHLLRLNLDGSSDMGTGAGQLNLGTGFTSSTTSVFALAVQANGQLLVGGSYTAYKGGTANRFVRLTATGDLNTTATPVTGASYTFSPGGSTGTTLVVTTTGSYTVTASGPDGCVYISAPVAVSVVPVITSLSTNAELPGMPVVLTGAGFTANSTVSFGGVAAANVVFNTSTSLITTVPAGATPGSSTIVVTSDGVASTSAPAFTVLQVYSAAVGSCPTTLTYTTTGDGAWHYLLTVDGQVVAALQDTRAALGDVAVQYTVVDPASPVRQDQQGHAYFDRNFHLTTTGGPFAGNTVNVRFYGLTSEFARLQAADARASYAALKATQYSGPNEDCDLSNDDATNGQFRALAAPASTPGGGVPWFVAQVAVADHFSEFYLTSAPTPLPITLVTFTAQDQGPDGLLRWTTASELRNDHFVVESSIDGVTFQALGQVAGHGTSAQTHDYQLLDRNLARYAAAQVYYRLRQIDVDGMATYSPVRTVQVPLTAGWLVQAYPNPSSSAAAVVVQVHTAHSGQLQLTLTDAVGRLVGQQSLAVTAGTTMLPLEATASLKTGVYTLQVRQDAQQQTIKLVRQ